MDLEEVLDLVAAAVELLAQLRLVLADPFERAVEGVDRLPGMEAGIGADPDRDRARGQGDQPDPVTLPAEMVRAVLAQAPLGHAREELLVGGIYPILDVQPAGQPEPRRVHDVTVVLEQPELALEQEGASGRVDHPAGLDRRLLSADAAADDGDRMGIGLDVHVADEAAAEQVHPRRQILLGEEVLEAPAVELVARMIQEAVRAPLHALCEVAVVARREPPAQPELLQLIFLEMV